ncbi:App1 family protein [Sphaerothrix gracilis]|uniref:App1 family protein n=1 Tax=Sphaerothrix gracilis TaxID=3151835 RepID=UPI0031FD2326
MFLNRRDLLKLSIFLPLAAPSWARTVSDWTGQLNRLFDRAKKQVLKALNLEEPLQIMTYMGYGTPQQLHFMGRVLQDEKIDHGTSAAPIWKNLLNMYRRFESDEIPGAKLRLTFGDRTQEFETDAEGYFHTVVELAQPLERDRLWYTAELELLEPEPPKQERVTAIAPARIPGATAQFGLISDVDDTVVNTGGDNFFRMVQMAYLGNAYTRIPLPGMARLYQALESGDRGERGNPIFYVSSSPWNMYDVFERFIAIHGLPPGPVFLHDIELALDNILSFSHEKHKRQQIEPILQLYSDLPFILVGDSGQQDAEIYARLVQDYPGRILCIYIREVNPADQKRRQVLEAIAAEVAQQGSELVLMSSTAVAANHAAQQTWISQAALTALQEETGDRPDSINSA